ncbi:hypothetical protein EFT57_06725 [Lacticaseibacillus paracasei]|nr:hypothetical protein [Lacticaseibacillus paracasei]
MAHVGCKSRPAILDQVWEALGVGTGPYHRYYKWVQDTVQYTSGKLTSDSAVCFLSDVKSATIMWKVDKRFAQTKKSHHF